MSARYSGDLAAAVYRMHQHSLYRIRQAMGSQCDCWIRLRMVWLEVRRPKISHVAAIWTCCSGPVVVCGKAANTRLFLSDSEVRIKLELTFVRCPRDLS